MPFKIIQDNITKVKVDAIVNAANTSLQAGGGVCGAIFAAAGADRLQAACNDHAPIKTGEAVITKGFNLPAKFVIHTAGPIYREGVAGQEELLRACYINSLKLALQHGCETIAFPLISSGIYGYPKVEALRVATEAIKGVLEDNDIDVTLVVFDKQSFVVSEGLLGAVGSYIDEHFTDESTEKYRSRIDSARQIFSEKRRMSAPPPPSMAMPSASEAMFEVTVAAPAPAAAARLDDLVGNLDESFSATLLRLIDATGKKDAEVYRRANIDRRLFSKIRSNEGYAPSKATVLAFAVALELNIEQTADLLRRAGFALTHSRKFDVIVEFFIKSRKYDIFEINEVLFSYDQQLLGG
jgi:O-acetyl-ADP-ribose deacetylase (regulator of RNase III)